MKSVARGHAPFRGRIIREGNETNQALFPILPSANFALPLLLLLLLTGTKFSTQLAGIRRLTRTNRTYGGGGRKSGANKNANKPLRGTRPPSPYPPPLPRGEVARVGRVARFSKMFEKSFLAFHFRQVRF